MKRFFKLNVFALVALLFLGVADVWGIGINKNVPLNLELVGGNCTWDLNTKKLTWTASTWNLYKLKDWDDSDLSGYDKMVINVSNATQDKAYRVVITIDGTLYTYSTSGNGTKTIDIRNDFKNGTNTIQSIDGNPLRHVESIQIGGDSEPDKDGQGNVQPASITINFIKFHKPLNWNRSGRITFYAPDFNCGDNVTAGSEGKFTLSKKYSSIYLEFDNV
jgi:hypothetical protein